MKLKLLLVFIAVAGFTRPALSAEQGDDNPVGVSGIFNGQITTAGNYDPYTGNAMRVVDDIVVPGSVGAYPLKWTRYFNSHVTYQDDQIGGAWRFSYRDYKYFSWNDPRVPTGWPCHPDGRRVPQNGTYGVEEFVDSPYPYTTETLHLPDGGKVVSNMIENTHSYQGHDFYTRFMYPVQIVDPYGQVTTLSWVVYGWSGSPPNQSPLLKLDRVTEPGGRYLQVNWDSTSSYITSVQAFDGITGHTTPTQWVNYTWTTQTLSLQNGGGHPNSFKVLTRVDYSDGTFATYTYTEANYPVPICTYPYGTDYWYAALLATADDTRYNGPMRQIAYQYYTGGNKTRISSEKNLVTGAAVSTIVGVANNNTQQVMETRGDGATRTLDYYKGAGCPDCPPPGYECAVPTPTDGKLKDYKDFLGHTTTLSYETNDTLASAGFINALTDANNHTTTYARQTGSWGVTTITYPDNSTIIQKYWPNDSQTQPYYLWKRTDERGNTTTYNRDASNRIIEKDYAPDGNGVYEYETFTYNSFDQMLTHRMKNGAYEYLKYDSRGLLTDKTNPTWTYYPAYDPSNPSYQNNFPTSEPKTHYDYYTSADYNGVWTDRVKTATDPRGLITQFDYDRALDANGQNSGYSTSQAPVGGRGLVTRVTHVSDSSTYQSFGFDKYANKLWEENELRQRTSYTYDDYRRVLTIKNPLNQIVTNTYTPTNGTNTSPYVHTTSSIYTTTTPTGIVTKNIYDQNFRKTSTTQAYGTSLAATTTLAYDPVGNPTSLTDPLNHTTTTAYDTRNRKITVTDALNQMTQWFYDPASNVTSIQRADGTTETKTYDQMNRVLTDTVPQTSTVNVTTTFTYYPGNVQYGGLPKQVIDADGHITTFTAYDPSGLKTTVTYPNGDTHGFTYDNDHNLISRRTVNGTTQNFTYDTRSRKITMAWADASPTPAPNFTAEWSNFGYDAASRLTSAQNGIGAVGTGIISTITRQYDGAGRLILDRQNLNATLGDKDVQYSYDADGKDTRLYLTSAGYDYTFSYDAMGRFEKMFSTGGAQLFQYRYDAASNEVERDNLGNLVNQFYTRDTLNRMSERDVKLNTTVLSSEAYGYDAMSRMLSVAREDGKTDAFTYYLDGELWTAQYGASNRSVTYNIDQMGNRTSVLDTGVTTTYGQAAGGLNQYSQVGTDTVGNGSEHEIASYQGINYGYINDERLSSVTSAGNNYALAYDAVGRCVQRTLNGMTTYYIYDGEKPIVEYNSAGSVVGRNLYGKAIDEILLRTDYTASPARTFYYEDDHEGSVTHLTDGSGNIVESYRYDVFGKPTIKDGSGNVLTASAYGNRFMFTGREYTSTFGIYEYRARAYHPGLGRFTGEDPKGFAAGDYNLFRYVGNDPGDKTDPMGLLPIDADPALEPYITQAAARVWQSFQGETFLGMNLPLTGFKSEWAASVVQDNNTKEISATQARTDGKGGWGGWVRTPFEAGKTNLVDVHIHTVEHRPGFDHITGSEFSAQDIAHGDLNLNIRRMLLLLPSGRQQQFRPDTNTQVRKELHGGVIEQRDSPRQSFEKVRGSNTDLRGRLTPGQLRSIGQTLSQGASQMEPPRAHSMLIGDTGTEREHEPLLATPP